MGVTQNERAGVTQVVVVGSKIPRVYFGMHQVAK